MKRKRQSRRGSRPAKRKRTEKKGLARKARRVRPNRKRKSNRRARSRQNLARPQTSKQFFAMSRHGQDEWKKVTSVVSEARATGKSPRKIAERLGIEFETVRRKSGRVIRKRNGRYVVQPRDRLLRVLALPTPKGLREIATRDSRQASLIAEYWIAVSRYLETGDASALRKFDGKRVVDANGKRVLLLTDPAELDRLGTAGVLSFETIYARR